MAYGTQFSTHNEKLHANRSDFSVAVPIENVLSGAKPALNGDTTLQAARWAKDGCQPRDTKFPSSRRVNAPSGRPNFQLYWGKPAVRMGACWPPEPERRATEGPLRRTEGRLSAIMPGPYTAGIAGNMFVPTVTEIKIPAGNFNLVPFPVVSPIDLTVV
jgi:hypothetical protein